MNLLCGFQVLDGTWQFDADCEVHEPAAWSTTEDGPGLDQRGAFVVGDPTDCQHIDGPCCIQWSAVLVNRPGEVLEADGEGGAEATTLIYSPRMEGDVKVLVDCVF